jgi:CheY-like chemotaxis protein
MFHISTVRSYLQRVIVSSTNLMTSLKPFSDKAIKILVVEDSQTERMYMGDMLGRKGFVVSFAEDGKQAIDILKVRKFDLVFMNCLMPEMDGFQATRYVRRNERTNSLPRTVIVGTSLNPDFRERCLSAGADDFIEVQSQTDDWLQIISKWVPLAETKAQPVES